MKMLSQIKRMSSRLVINNHWYHWLYYHQRLSPTTQPNVSRIYIILPMLYLIFFLIRGASYLLYPQYFTNHPVMSLALSTGLLSPQSRQYIEMSIQFWTILVLGCNAIEMCGGPHNLAFLKLVFADRKHLDLDRVSAYKFIALRTLLIRVLFVQISWIQASIFTMVMLGSFMRGKFQVSRVFCILGCVLLDIYAYYVDYAIYAQPYLLVIMVNYLKRKQSHLVGRLDRLIVKKKFNLVQLKCLNREYVQLSTTVDKYDGNFWSYFLTHFVFMYSLLISYLVYILFYNDVPLNTYISMSSIGVAHFICFVTTLQSVAVVYTNNQMIQAKFHQLHHRFVLNIGNAKHFLKSNHSVRESLLLERQTSHVCAFTFITHLPITPITVLNIIYNISQLFILIFFT